jgi:hypothetical protein
VEGQCGDDDDDRDALRRPRTRGPVSEPEPTTRWRRPAPPRSSSTESVVRRWHTHSNSDCNAHGHACTRGTAAARHGCELASRHRATNWPLLRAPSKGVLPLSCSIFTDLMGSMVMVRGADLAALDLQPARHATDIEGSMAMFRHEMCALVLTSQGSFPLDI